MTIYQVSFRSILSITYSPWLVIYKKGMALTIPYSGKPERPRRANYPFNGGLVDQKTLVSKCEKAVIVPLLIYIILNFVKKSIGNMYK